MNDENDKSKKDDWGMAMSHLHTVDEKGAGDFSDDLAAPPKSAKQSQMDEWEMVQPNLNKPTSQPSSSDSDKIAANINIPKNIRQDETPATANQPPNEDWGRTVHNITISREEKSADWEVNVPPPVNNPKQGKNDNWSMPEPVFRVSEGENLEEVAKRTAVFNLKDIAGYGETASDFNFSEVSPPESFKQTSPNLNIQPQPYISESFPASEIAVENKPPVPSNNYKALFIIVGLFLMLLFASVVFFGIYLLFRNNP